MTNGKPSTYYQPELYYDDGTNIGWELSEGLFSFQAFPSREECETWLEDNGYEPGECVIHEYHGDDIEGVTILDGNGDVIYIEEEE